MDFRKNNLFFNSFNLNYLQVSYPSLKDEIKIGDYYLRILLEQDVQPEDSPIRKS